MLRAAAQRRGKDGRRVETTDVVVIGGGIVGVCTAHALARRRARVVLLEKAALASGASGRSSALIRMHYTNEWDARLAVASFPTFARWPEVMGAPDIFVRTGFLNVVAPRYAEHLRRNVAMLQALGVNTRALSASDVAALQPFFTVEDVGAAAYEPDSGYVSPAEAVEGFRRSAEALGAAIRPWTAVTRIRREGDRVTGVSTPAGELSAGAVVLATGPWSPRLCQELGVDVPVDEVVSGGLGPGEVRLVADDQEAAQGHFAQEAHEHGSLPLALAGHQPVGAHLHRALV